MSVDAAVPLTLRTVLLSGATGAVGREIARQLVASDVRLGVAVRKSWQVAKMREELGDAAALVGHVPSTDGEAAAGLVKGVEDALGPIDAFVSCTGKFTFAAPGSEHADVARDLFDANVFAVVNLVRAVVPPMKRRNTGSLVFTGARLILDAAPGEVAGVSLYCAAKSALHAYGASLSRELAGDGLRAVVVAPGVIDTEANRTAMPDADRAAWHSVAEVARALIDAAAGRIDGPVHRVGDDSR